MKGACITPYPHWHIDIFCTLLLDYNFSWNIIVSIIVGELWSTTYGYQLCYTIILWCMMAMIYRLAMSKIIERTIKVL